MTRHLATLAVIGDRDVTQVTMFRTKAGKVAVPRFPKGTHIDNWQPRHQ